MVLYNYIISRAIVFLSAYLIVYAYDTIGFIAAIPFFLCMMIYSFTVFCVFASITFWVKRLKLIVSKPRKHVEDIPYWYVFHGIDSIIFVALAGIFTFNHFDGLATWMIYAVPVSVSYIFAIVKVRQITEEHKPR